MTQTNGRTKPFELFHNVNKHHNMIRENSNDMIWSCSLKGWKKKLENQFKNKNKDHLAMSDDVFIGKLSFGDRIPEG